MGSARRARCKGRVPSATITLTRLCSRCKSGTRPSDVSLQRFRRHANVIKFISLSPLSAFETWRTRPLGHRPAGVPRLTEQITVQRVFSCSPHLVVERVPHVVCRLEGGSSCSCK